LLKIVNQNFEEEIFNNSLMS